MSRSAGERIEGIQALRAIAALLVMFDHGFNLPLPHAAQSRFGWYVGLVGVCLFFVISGFIMAKTTADMRGRSDAARFVKNRLVRIAPVYWIATFVTVFVGWTFYARPLPVAAKLISSVAFYPLADGHGGAIRPVLGQGWTLDLEMFFYALFGAAIAVAAPVKRPAMIGLMTALAIGGLLFAPRDGLSMESTAFGVWTSGLLLFFAAGICLWKRRLPTTTIPFGVELSFALVVLVICAPSLWGGNAWPPPAASFVVLLAGSAICVSMASRAKSTALSRGLAAMGQWSYSAYLFHPLAFLAVDAIAPAALGPRVATDLALGVPLAWLSAALQFHFVERPLTQWLRMISFAPVRLLAPVERGRRAVDVRERGLVEQRD